MRVRAWVVATCTLMISAPAAAQDPAPASWQWTADANVFFGFNYQRRKFTDFNAWESQNWLMGSGTRGVGGGTLRLQTMLSFEAFTLRDIGSPQVFQTGETFEGAPLIDYQHPHDLIMGLGADYRRTRGSVTLLAGVDVVGAPTLGPPVFMHRPSAAENPQAPLSHHYMDSSHITPGVLRGGVETGAWRVEASWFRGREPDEDRTDLDLGALDSYAARLSWTRGRWAAQVSGANLTQPERLAPYDAKQVSASLAWAGGDDRRSFAWMAGFGQKREIHGNLEAYLLEATVRWTPADTFYTRVESVAKSILDAGFHPPGLFHRHRQSQVGALTVGYVRDLLRTRAGSFGIGGDVTGYAVPANLEDSYGAPASFHLFLRYRARTPAQSSHAHH